MEEGLARVMARLEARPPNFFIVFSYGEPLRNSVLVATTNAFSRRALFCPACGTTGGEFKNKFVVATIPHEKSELISRCSSMKSNDGRRFLGRFLGILGFATLPFKEIGNIEAWHGNVHVAVQV